MGTDASVWFDARPPGAVHDFFEVFDRDLEVVRAGAWTLAPAAARPDAAPAHDGQPPGAAPNAIAGASSHATVPEPPRGAELEAARARLRRARDGDWQPLEQHLRDLGARYAHDGLLIASWYGFASGFYNAIVAKLVDAYAAEPARLTQVLLVLGDYLERSLSLIAGDYHAVRARLDREADARHRLVLEASLDAVIAMDERGAVTDINAAAERTFGYARGDARGRQLADLIIPARFRAHHRAGLARFLATGEARVLRRRIEVTAMRADGSELPVELIVVSTRRGDGPQMFTGFLRDLTEQKRHEESLALRAHALENAQFGIVISDPVARTITNVNPAYARMVGYAPHELIGSDGIQLLPPEDYAAMAAVASTLRRRGHHTYELRLVRKDGSIVPTFASSSTVETRPGTRVTVSTVIDLSERDQHVRVTAEASAALARSAARLEIVSSTAHEFVVQSGDIAALLALVARRLGEIIGDGCAVRLISDDGEWLEPSTSFFHRDPASREQARHVLGSERQRVGEGIAGRVAATGEAVLIPRLAPEQLLASVAPVFRPAMAGLGVVSALAIPLRSRDRTIGAISLLRTSSPMPYTIDDQRLAQDLADRAGLAIDNAVLVATLEQRVAQRTAALETANRELEAFSYSASHDLRTPLRAIDGFSRMLLADYDDKLDDRGKHYLQRIRAGTQRMASLIDDLLNLARITRVPLRPTMIDLSALAAEVAAEIRRRDPARAVPIYIAPRLWARADPRLMRVVLENLLGNAWKFTSKSPGAEIWFGADGRTFYVRDTGAGFDMAYAEKLFVPFQRLHTVHEFDGIGVGLATVQRIVTHHGGRIWAEGEVGKGASFWFTLGDHA